jgi:hypothetical protein
VESACQTRLNVKSRVPRQQRKDYFGYFGYCGYFGENWKLYHLQKELRNGSLPKTETSMGPDYCNLVNLRDNINETSIMRTDYCNLGNHGEKGDMDYYQTKEEIDETRSMGPES